VRLKDSSGDKFNNPALFQFLLVRLKVFFSPIHFGSCLISIPFGAIKSLIENQSITELSQFISIPFGAIKS